MSSNTTSNSREAQKENLEEVQDGTIQPISRRTADTPGTKRDHKTKLASGKAAAPTLGTKILNDTAYHESEISGSDLVLENHNEIEYSTPGNVHFTTTAFRKAIITGGKISSGIRAAPRTATEA